MKSLETDTRAILEIGCGKKKLYPHSVSLDICETAGPDVVHDLNVYPYPFEADTFDLVTAVHVLEHIDDVVKTVEEVHRILKSGGIFYVQSPHFSSVFAYSDPTHKHFFTSRSFDYFIEGTAVSEFDYSPVRFVIRRRELMLPGDGLLRRAVRGWVNGHLDLYEKRLAFIWPRHTVEFELEAVK